LRITFYSLNFNFINRNTTKWRGEGGELATNSRIYNELHKEKRINRADTKCLSLPFIKIILEKFAD
jgi:hypothetical protein